LLLNFGLADELGEKSYRPALGGGGLQKTNMLLKGRAWYNKTGKVYFLEYTKIPQVFFTPHSMHTLWNVIALNLHKGQQLIIRATFHFLSLLFSCTYIFTVLICSTNTFTD
jgi:hypothetical protein